MKIAELFVELGLRGDDKAQKQLSGVQSSLKGILSTSLQTKAAVLAATYFLDKMISTAGRTGTSLLNFSSVTGLSAKDLQKWQYAARQAGVDGEELAGSVKSVQSAMTSMLLGKGAPEGMAMLANKIGFDPSRARDTFYVMEKLQEFAKKVPRDVGTAMLASFGLTEGVIAAMYRNTFRPELMAKAPRYSESEITTLNKVDVAWSNIFTKIKMAMGHLVARHGLILVKDISHLVDTVTKLANSFVVLAEKIKLVEIVGKIFEGWSMIFDLITKSIGAMMEFFGLAGKNLPKDPVSMFSDWLGKKAESAGESYGKAFYEVEAYRSLVKPSAKSGSVNTNNITVHNHGVKDAQDSAKHFGRELNRAYRQMNQAQGG